MGINERKKREKEQRKTQIIKAGEKLFLKKGLGNTTMDEIAKSCELSKGTLYLYFRSKEELYLTIMLKAMNILYEMMKEKSEKAPVPPEKFRAIGEAYLEYYKKYPHYFNIITRFVDHSLLADRAEIKEVLGEIFKANNKVWELITRIIVEGIKKGFFNNKVNPMELAIIMWTSSNGMIQFMDHLKNEEHHEEDGAFMPFNLNSEDMLRKTWELIMDGIIKEETRK
ncbi:MAG: TetR/AcrR family transcriptional regulator [bacterium]|nr:TetR/AcrR family transcriptional regulator [bacterium]